MGKHLVLKTVVYTGLYLATAGIILSVFSTGIDGDNRYPLLRAFIIFFATILLTKYFVYMTLSPWYDVVSALRRKPKAAAEPHEPLVSVIIPAWNEQVGLLNTVKTVLASEYRPLEVVVVNDGSTDGSDAAMHAFMEERLARDPSPAIPLLYRYQEKSGKGAALNRGIAAASGDIIVSIDADCALPPSSIGNFVRHFEDPKVMAAVGNVKIGNTMSLLGMLQYLEFLFSFYFKKADSLLNTIYIIGGAAGAFRREVFEQVGYYSSKNITEDIDLSVRIQDKGMKIVYAADAVVYTEGATNIGGLMRQRLRWKRGRFETFATHKHLFFSTAPRHNKLLTWLVLPFALFGDVQLFFELLFLGFLYLYALATGDFSSFISGIIIVSFMFLVQIFDDRKAGRFELYLLAPVGWLFFYLTTLVEYHALIRSAWSALTGQKLRWQRWQRSGVALDARALRAE